MLTDAQLAAALINTRQLPAGLSSIRDLSREARAYQAQKPYPLYHFRDWRTEDRGPLPVCLPLAKSIVERGAKWLFGKPIQITVPGNSALETKLRDVWQQNSLDSRLRPMAKNAALDGGIVLKFAYDASKVDRPVSIMALSLVDEVRLYPHPHDAARILMARVQYAYVDAVDGKTKWYREEWTDGEEVHYHDVDADLVLNAKAKGDPDSYEGWEISSQQANPFGLIPLHLIKNLETDDVFGAGDLWDPAEGNGIFRTLDRIHLTYHLMDKSNQFDSEINPIFIDLELDEQDIDKPLQPGQGVDAHSSEADAGKQGKVVFPQGGNGLRPAMMEYAKDLRKQVLDAASSVQVDQSEFTNKGNLTRAVLEQLYQPQIELTDEKRKSWGADGLGKFLSLLARGLAKAGLPELGITAKPDSSQVIIKFGDYFEMSEDEKTEKTGRLQEQEIAGYLPHDRAIEEISQMEGREDVAAIKKELAAQPAPTPTEQDPSLQNMETEIKGLNRVGGNDSQ